MRGLKSKILGLGLYTGLAMLANAAVADLSDISAMREGDMRKLNFHSSPERVADTPFMHEDGSEMTLADLKGQITVLNFWATWCAPCRAEMPGLSELQADLGSDGIQVITVATGRNTKSAMQRFFDEINVDNLPLHTDAQQSLARAMGVFGLPVTVIMDRDGNEIGRLQGDAEWNSDNAKAILTALAAQGS